MNGRWMTIGSGMLGLFCLVVGFVQFLDKRDGAEWLTAAGGFSLIAFAAAQIRLEEMRELQRQQSARAKIKPVARLARRSCEQGIIESNGKPLNQWLHRWSSSTGHEGPSPLDILEGRMRETVSLAAEAGGSEAQAADSAFDAFIAAADIINDLSRTLLGPQDTRVLEANNPRGMEAVKHLRKAAGDLAVIAPRGPFEPKVPVEPKFEFGK